MIILRTTFRSRESYDLDFLVYRMKPRLYSDEERRERKKVRDRLYSQRPERKARQREYLRAYFLRPDIKEKMRKYQAERYRKKSALLAGAAPAKKIEILNPSEQRRKARMALRREARR